MESVARFMVASTDLLEAEARVFKRAAVRLSLAAGVALVALVLTMIAVGFATYGIFVLLAHLIHSYWGAAPDLRRDRARRRDRLAAGGQTLRHEVIATRRLCSSSISPSRKISMATVATAPPVHPTPLPPGDVPSDGTSLDAAAVGVPEHTALALAKLRLMESAREIQPLRPLREHPWATVGIAAGTGAVLGSTGGAALAFSSVIKSLGGLVGSLAKFAGPLASVVGPIVAGKVAGDSAADANANVTSDATAS